MRTTTKCDAQRACQTLELRYHDLTLLVGLTLPDDEDAEAEAPHRAHHATIASHVGRELVLPERAIPLGSGRSTATWMSMPEAPVDEDRPTILLVHDVRGSGKSSSLRSIGKADFAQRPAHLYLGGGVLLSNLAEAL